MAEGRAREDRNAKVARTGRENVGVGGAVGARLALEEIAEHDGSDVGQVPSEADRGQPSTPIEGGQIGKAAREYGIEMIRPLPEGV